MFAGMLIDVVSCVMQDLLDLVDYVKSFFSVFTMKISGRWLKFTLPIFLIFLVSLFVFVSLYK